MGKEEVLLNTNEIDELLKKYSGNSSAPSSNEKSSEEKSSLEMSSETKSAPSQSVDPRDVVNKNSIANQDGSYRMSMKKTTSSRTSTRVYPNSTSKTSSSNNVSSKAEESILPESGSSVSTPESSSENRVSSSVSEYMNSKTERKFSSEAEIDSYVDKILNKKPPTIEDRLISEKEEEREKKKKAAEEKARKQQQKNIINKIMNVVLVICILVFVGSAGYLLRYYMKIRKAEKGFDNVKSMIVKESASPKKDSKSSEKSDVSNGADVIKLTDVDGVPVQEKFVKLYQTNKDFVGWLEIPGTNIDYPVMQTKDDEEYYLHRDFDKEYSDSGTLFASAKSKLKKPSDNVLIYGHNMKAGTMFSAILDYDTEDFYNKHHTIYFDTLEDNGKYEVIAAFRTEINDDAASFKYYDFYEAETPEEFQEYVDKAKSLTPYKIEKTAEYGEKLLTLSTCSYHANEGRYVVVAKKVHN